MVFITGEKPRKNIAPVVVSKIKAAKLKLPLPQLMQQLGYGTRARKAARCPFHEDTSPSFSVWNGTSGWRWKCHGGCGGGDEIDFVRVDKSLSERAAVAVYLQLADGSYAEETQQLSNRVELVHPDAPSQPYMFAPIQPVLTTDYLLNTLSRARPYGLEGLKWASRRGVLKFFRWRRSECYGVTDRRNKAQELRKMDQTPFGAHRTPSHTLSPRKSHAVKGSVKDWPIGVLESEKFPRIAVTEGIPDFLECHDRIIRERARGWAPVCMLGASCRMNEGALRFFKNKIIRIYAHSDTQGLKAARMWADQLEAVTLHLQVITMTAGDLFDSRKYCGKLMR